MTTTRSPRRWTDDAIHAALSLLIGDGDYWPTSKEFRAARLTGLESLLRKRGEKPRWMREFGVTVRSGYSDDQVMERLRTLTEGMTDFPTRRQFEAFGERRLLQLVQTRGGAAAWAEKLGLRFEGPSRNVKKRFYDTPEFISEMKRVCAGFGGMPTEGDLINAGRFDLMTPIRKHGGYPAVAAMLGETRRRCSAAPRRGSKPGSKS